MVDHCRLLGSRRVIVFAPRLLLKLISGETMTFFNREATVSELFPLVSLIKFELKAMLSKWLLLGCISGIARAQFPPEPKGITVLKSKFHENVTISYKEVRCTGKVQASLS